MATAKKAAVNQKAATDKTASAPAKKRAPNPAFMKPMTPSQALANVIGTTPLPRTEATSKIWEYIKKHALQDPNKKRLINADETLKDLFGKPQIDMLELPGIINKNLS